MAEQDRTIVATINGIDTTVTVDPRTPTIYVLRNDLGLIGTRLGCGQGECGSCMILLDGIPTRSCDLPIEAIHEHRVTTIEGLGNENAPHPIQSAIVREQAAQCGYCLSGIMISASVLSPGASEQSIRASLDKHLCRCGTHARIVRAVMDACSEGLAP